MNDMLMSEQDKKLDLAAKQALAYVTSKHNDIVILANSIAELRQMFVDLSVLVERQGEVITKIEQNCELALEYTEEGVANLKEANQISKQSSKLLCIVLIVVALIMVVVVCAVLAPILFNAFKKEDDDDWLPF